MPPWLDPGLASPADHAACRELLRNGSRSFLAASHLLPGRVRDDAIALYAFCRVADDAIDVWGGNDALLSLQRRLDLVYQGTPMPIAADRVLADLVARRGIPKLFLTALLEGFSWDADGRCYEDLPALIDYAVRVAGSVGAMMALLMDARSPEQLARACELGVAMQLTNIARDVGEDARAGRLYLPRTWLREAGIDSDAWLEQPVFSPALAGVVRRVLAAAEVLYRQADAGIASLPAACRPGIRAARLLYAQIGRRIAENRFDSVSVRAVVPALRKPVLVLRGFIPVAEPGMNSVRPPLAQAAFLLAAVDDIRPRNRRSEQPRLAGPGVRARVIWLIDFLARLERQETFGRRPQFVGEGTVDILPPDRNKMLTLPQQALNATMRRQTSSP